MRLAFDSQAFCLQKTGGISRYYARLARELYYRKTQIGIFAPLHRNQYLSQLNHSLVHGWGVTDYPYRCANLAVSLNAFIAEFQLKQWRPDVVHETYFSRRKSGVITCPSVLTVFDMIPELGIDSERASEAQLKQSDKYLAVARATHIVCISARTRQDLIDIYNISPEKISTIYLGCDLIGNVGKYDRDRLSGGERPYLLYVGVRDGYKNFELLLRAYASSHLLRRDFDLLAFGGGAFSAKEASLIRALNLQPSQIRQTYGSDDLLAATYRGASAFVYPSLYEGFGLPPLEAMANSCPVVSSQTSAMPEVIGEAALYFDPRCLESIATAIEKLVSSADLAKKLILKGHERTKLFTWDRCASQHLNLYESLTAESSKS